MITYLNALKILKKYIKDPKVILHSKGVSDFALMLAEKIGHHRPELKINKEKVRIAALLHDIGKEHRKGHEERSLRILENEGLGEIANIAVHGFRYMESEKKKLNYTEEVENKIVAYSDLRFKFSPITPEDRLQEVKKGWKGTAEEIKAKEDYARGVALRFEKEIFELAGEEV